MRCQVDLKGFKKNECMNTRTNEVNYFLDEGPNSYVGLYLISADQEQQWQCRHPTIHSRLEMRLYLVLVILLAEFAFPLS